MDLRSEILAALSIAIPTPEKGYEDDFLVIADVEALANEAVMLRRENARFRQVLEYIAEGWGGSELIDLQTLSCYERDELAEIIINNQNLAFKVLQGEEE